MSAICFKKLLERGINASLDCEPNSDRRENLGTRFCSPYGKDIGFVTCECCKNDWFVYTWRPEIWHPRQPWTNEKTRQCMMSVWPTWDVIPWHDWQSKVLFSVRIYWVCALDRTGAVRRIDGLYRAGIDALYLVILRYWYFKEGGGWASSKIGLGRVRSISLHALLVLDPSLLTTTCNTLKNVTNLQSFGSSCLSVLSIVLDIFLYSYVYSFLDI